MKYIPVILISLAIIVGLASINMSRETMQLSNAQNKLNLDWNIVSRTRGFPDINLRAYEGEVIFLNLWAEWCGPCVEEMPFIQNLYSEYRSRVKFVTVVPEYTEATEAYMAETGYCFPVYEAHLPQSYGHESFPTTWIIDRESNVVIHHIGSFQWDSKEVKDLLDSLL